MVLGDVLCHHVLMMPRNIPDRFAALPWDRIVHYCAFLTLACVVLLFGDTGWGTTCIIIFVALIAAFATFLSRSKENAVPMPLHMWVCLTAFVMLSVVAFAVSATPVVGFDEVLRDIAYVLLFFSVARLPSPLSEEDSFAKLFVRSVSFIVLATCAVGAARYAMGLEAFLRIPGPRGDVAWQGFLILSWPILLQWALSAYDFRLRGARGHGEMLLRALVIGFVGASMLLSLHAASFVILFLQSALWLGMFLPLLRPVRRFAFVLPLIVLIAAFTTLVTITLSTFHQQFASSEDDLPAPSATVSYAGGDVATFARQAVTLMQEKPAFGWGPGSFSFVRWTVAEHAYPANAFPSNILLTLGSERGVFVALIFALLLALIVTKTILGFVGDNAGSQRFLSLRSCTLVAASGVLMQNMVVSSIDSAAVALPFWLMLGALTAGIRDRFSVPKRLERSFGILMSSFLLLALFYQAFFSAELVWAARKESLGNLRAALLWYTRASSGFLQRDVLLRRAALHLKTGDPVQAETLVRRYIDTMPDDWKGWKLLGEIQHAKKMPDQELEAYAKAFERGRFTNISVIRIFVEAQREAENLDAIDRRKVVIDELLDEFAVLIGANVSGIAESDNVENFIAVCNDFAALYPEESPRYTVAAARVDRLARMYRKKP